jgi:hypothetical protein
MMVPAGSYKPIAGLTDGDASGRFKHLAGHVKLTGWSSVRYMSPTVIFRRLIAGKRNVNFT